ncbi:hypothetical protein B0H13DRAFT_2328957 [Mycena leptocephala]|nr:hypothetical protein B0H13DRAFT_2328957 [Mycena leptocephala]
MRRPLPRLHLQQSPSSLPIHPYHRDASFQPGATKGKEKCTYNDHQVTNEHLLVAGTNLQERVDRISSDVSRSQTSSPPCDARSNTVSDDRVLSDLWTSHHQHGENIHQHGIAITDISARLLFIGTSSSCRGPATGLTPSSRLSLLPPWLLLRRPRAPGTRMSMMLPTTLAHPPRSRKQWPCLPLLCTPCHSVLPLSPSVLPRRHHDASARADCTSCSTAALAPSALAQAPPAAPSTLPRASAPGPPAPSAAPASPPRACAIPQRQAASHVDPALQVIFGPIAWNRDSQNRTNIQQDLVNAHLGISSTRRYKKLNASAAVAFPSPEIANWVVDSWDHAAHYQYTGIYAVHPNA